MGGGVLIIVERRWNSAFVTIRTVYGDHCKAPHVGLYQKIKQKGKHG